MIRAMFRAILLLVLFAAVPAFAQEVAFAARASELKEQASADSRTVSSLAEGAELKVLQRSGGWARVEARGQGGWVRVFHLRFPVAAQAGGQNAVESGLSSLTSVFGSRSATKPTTLATTGIRGLSPEDLKNATPDPAALRQVQSYRADKASAERFAREGKLAASNVSYEAAR